MRIHNFPYRRHALTPLITLQLSPNIITSTGRGAGGPSMYIMVMLRNIRRMYSYSLPGLEDDGDEDVSVADDGEGDDDGHD